MAKATKFGAISGVFTPSILTILGVIMYLRLPWIVGQAGLWATIGIILVAHIISFSTSLSVSSIATDKKVETGGSYYIISRSLGLPIGGTLGLALFVGLSFSISLYLIGFAEVTLNYLGLEASINNIRLTGALALLAITILTFISTSLAIKAQYIILTALALSLVSIFFGVHQYDPSQPLIAPMQGALPWIALFAIFFPAVTGFEAGVSMSGDLKDPRKNIPGGTIAAVLVGLAVYLGLAFFLSYTVDRNLLANDPNVLFQIAWFPQLVVAGIIGATLSSALGSILGAPRILQATAIDRITPSILAKGFGASNEPRNALIFTFIIALSGILIGELNVIARIVTIFFIITYGFLNITYAVESWAGTDFRPSFKIPGVISIIGALACIIVMIQLDIIAMAGASLVLIGLFLFLKKRELTLQTGDTWNSVWASVVKTGLKRLTIGNRETRNWRPNVMLFSGSPKHRPHLIEMGKSLVGKLGIFTNFELIESKDDKAIFSKNQQVIAEEAANKEGVFTRRHACRDIYEGIESIAKIYGFSGYEPNTILMGWPKNIRNPEAFLRLFNVFKKLDFNQVFLDFKTEKAFGKKKKIDIWWGGKGRNLSFALGLIRFLSSSSKWRGVTLRILVINNQSNLSDKYYDLIGQILENKRIQAEIKVINNSVEQLPATEIMQSESLHTDLAIIELHEDKDSFWEINNKYREVLPSTLIISSSTFFEDITVVTQTADEKIPSPEETSQPDFIISERIRLDKREIIANEVYNIARKLQNATEKYYKESFGMVDSKTQIYHDELWSIVGKTAEQLYSTSKLEDDKERKGEFLKILNDFSFRSQKLLKGLRQDVLVYHKQSLQGSTDRYFRQMNELLSDLPRFIRVRYSWKEFNVLRADSLKTRLFKVWKVIKARITGKPAVYKIKVDRAAKYYLQHKRLANHKNLLHNFAFHNFENIVEIRKILSDVYELAEKCRSGKHSQAKLSNVIQMEKDRFKAAVSLMKDQSKSFHNEAGKILEKELLEDLQSFNNLLGRPGSNFMSRAFPNAFKNDQELLEEVTGFTEIWHNNASLFVNKIHLDFLLQSLKGRIEAKISKYNTEFRSLLNTSLLHPLSELKKQTETYSPGKEKTEKPKLDTFKPISPEEHYIKLFDEITALFKDLPLVLPIAGDDLSKSLENKAFAEAKEVTVSFRKTVELSIASEFIDFIKKQEMETSIALNRSINQIRDIIRLINFNLFDETDTESQDKEEKERLAKDFASKLENEEIQINSIVSDFENSFTPALKNTFSPLASGIIAKTSGIIEKKHKATESRKILGHYKQGQEQLIKGIRKQIVNIIYSRSESILWMGRMEKLSTQTELSNEDIYTYLDNYAPSEGITKQLPFYYKKLFSGQSGIGEDFWVGMENEINQATKAIQRFRNGQPGFLIISGLRNSGKTSLSKFVAQKHFSQDEIHNIRAPRESSADVSLFEKSLLKSINSSLSHLETALNGIPEQAAFIINDLELWWERKEGGTVVIRRIMELSKQFNHKIFFIINLNVNTLSLINQITDLRSWALGQVICTGFDARDLHELIMLRHKAGGMNLVVNKKSETEMNAWDYASLFNRFFDISRGNPGAAINLWLSSIKSITGKSIYMEKPAKPDYEFLNKLSQEQMFYLLQFVYHMRLSAQKMASLLQDEYENPEAKILNMWQSGILVEKFPGIYAINPALQQPIEEKMHEFKLL